MMLYFVRAVVVLVAVSVFGCHVRQNSSQQSEASKDDFRYLSTVRDDDGSRRELLAEYNGIITENSEKVDYDALQRSTLHERKAFHLRLQKYCLVLTDLDAAGYTSAVHFNVKSLVQSYKANTIQRELFDRPATQTFCFSSNAFQEVEINVYMYKPFSVMQSVGLGEKFPHNFRVKLYSVK